ncbi:hypothetical protein SprV_0902734600 [Sparganum proliferum]
MIRALLQDCHLRLRKYNGVIRQEVTKCTDVIGEDGVTLLQQVIDKRARELRAQRDAELAAKLRSISHSSPGEDEILVHNMSSKQLTPTQLKVLSHEACFNTADADPVNLVATVESILKQTGEPDETTHLIRQQVTSLVMAHKPRAIITKAEQSALKALRNDTSIVILPADKGRSTVVLDKTDYAQKANALLEDRQAYLPCGEESIKTLVTQLEKTLADMQSNKAISKSVRLTIKPTDAAPARFYGLPKVHKPGLPLRPIVSLRGTPTYNLAKWLFRKLRSLTSNAATTVCSAAQFLERLKGIRLSEDEVMVSFDVTALFTSIPQCLAVQTVSDLLECKYDETDENVKRNHLIQLMKFCLKTFFTFEGRVYEQTKGTPMGSPLSGFIAEAVLQKVETEVFETYRSKFWARYVDDTFVIIKREMVQTFHNVLNSVSPDIQFTMEAENNNELPFLDVLVHRNPNGHLKTTVYRKAANTRQILSYHSKHPLSHKRSCVRTLYKRADTHCSEPDDKRSELRHLQRLFMANGYPRNFIERNRQSVPSRSPVTERPKVWRAFPYIDGVSEAVSRLLRPLGIGIAHRPESTIRHLVMRPKTPLPPGEITNVIYRIQCSSCEANYIGETGKRLQTRVGEHMRAVRRMDQLSLVAEHCANSGHTFAFQSAEILGRGNDRVTRETIEAWHTSTNSINRCVALPEAYQALRTQLREQTSKRGLRGERNAITAGSMGDANAAALQLGSGEGAIVTTVATPTCPAGEKTDGRSNINGPDEGASVTATYLAGENTGCRGGVKKIASLGRELRSMRTRAMTASARTPAPDER